MGRHRLLAATGAPIDLVAVQKVLARAVLELDDAAESHYVIYVGEDGRGEGRDENCA